MRDIQESQKGIACVTCIACITCMACIGRNAAQYGRRCRIESKLLGHTHKVVLENRDGRLLEDRMEARIGREGRGRIWGPSHGKLCAT